MTRREPLFGPNAFVFFLLLGFIFAVNYWLVPWAKSYGKPTLDYQEECGAGLPPPPKGFVVVCQSAKP